MFKVPVERNSPRIVNEIQEYARLMQFMRNNNLIFLEETGFDMHLICKYGYSPKNTNAYHAVKDNKGKYILYFFILSHHELRVMKYQTSRTTRKIQENFISLYF